MHQLQDLKQKLEEHRPANWQELPDLALYMDQVISYLPRQLAQFREGDALTSAMVNNYIKDGLVPRAEGKRYGKEHMGYLTAVCAMKKVLSVRDMGVLLSAGLRTGKSPEALYDYFCLALDQALRETAQRITDPEQDEAALARLALDLALRGYADQLACMRILDLLAASQEGNEGKEKRKKEKKKETR